MWAKRGTRPRGPRDQRRSWAYILGAVCPARCAFRARPAPPRCRNRLAAPGRHRLRSGARRSCRPRARRCWLPYRRKPPNPGKHHFAAVAALFSRTQSGREHLGLSTLQHALQHRLRRLRPYRLNMLRCLEFLRKRPQAYRIHHNSKLGTGQPLRPLVLGPRTPHNVLVVHQLSGAQNLPRSGHKACGAPTLHCG